MRHADPITMDHMIELRKKVQELEDQVSRYDAYISHVYRTAINIKVIARQQEDPIPTILEAIDFMLTARGTLWKR